MAPRHKSFKKKSAKKSKHSTSSASITTTATTTTNSSWEQSFINNVQSACTSSPNINDFLMYKSLTDFNSIMEICNSKLKKRRDMMITNHQNRVKSIINKIDMFTMSITPEVGNSSVGECTFWQVSMLGDATKAKSSRYANLCINEIRSVKENIAALHSYEVLQNCIGGCRYVTPDPNSVLQESVSDVNNVTDKLRREHCREGARVEDSSDMSTLKFERPTRARQQVVDILKKRQERTTSKSKSHKRNPLPSQIQTPDNPLLKSGTKTITPKVDLSKPTSVRRRPKQGEMAVSLTGSPLLVSSVMHDEFASVNVPLPDGKILAILPQTFGFEPDDIPNLDSETRQQLETLKSHLQVFCDRGTRN